MATLIPINKRQVKACTRCTHPITFVKNRTGKWYPVDVFQKGGEWMYRTGLGAYGNLTPWHRCDLATKKEQPVDPQAERKAQFIARWDELRVSGMPKDEMWAILNAEFADLG